MLAQWTTCSKLKTNFWSGNKEPNFRKEMIKIRKKRGNVVKHEKYSPANFSKFVHICTTCESSHRFTYVIQKYTKFDNFAGLHFPYFKTFRYQISQFF